jgi:hypothetical protein
MSGHKVAGSKKRKLTASETGPFVLRSLLEDVPLSAEGDNDDIEINCVEFLGEQSFISLLFLAANIYIAIYIMILHFIH